MYPPCLGVVGQITVPTPLPMSDTAYAINLYSRGRRKTNAALGEAIQIPNSHKGDVGTKETRNAQRREKQTSR